MIVQYEGLKVTIAYLSFQATVGSVIESGMQNYYMEVGVWLLVK